MKTVRLNLKDRSYDILIGFNILSRLGSALKKMDIGPDAYIVTNAFIKNRYGNALEKTLRASGISVKFRTIPDSEESKSIEITSGILKDLANYDKGKRVFIAAFGGGVVGDVAGFVASIYKRGIPYIQIPTTLLAQVDSAIGGKTAVDLAQGKNLVGAYYQPRLVFSELGFLKSLDARQVRSGLAEVIKYGIIKDAKLFRYLEKNLRNPACPGPAALEYIVSACSRIKAGIVSRDEKEKLGLRTVLNFGHTAGHAIEAASGYRKYNHGEALAIGMLIAARISRSCKLINDATLNRITQLIASAGLPGTIKNMPLQAIMNAFCRDKKFIGSRNRLVLTKGIGRTIIKENIPVEKIRVAIRERMV